MKIDTHSVKTEILDYKSIKKYHGETIEELSLFVEPFGIEIRTDKAIYQIYKNGRKAVAERTTFDLIGEDKDAPWCAYPEKNSCRGCSYSLAPYLYDGGCKLLAYRKEVKTDERNQSSGNTSR